MLKSQIAESTLPNMFDTHPPFQIDGNFGGAAAIAEMLLQSDDEGITLLPALPRAWNQGRVYGLRARGGIAVEMEWRDGALLSAKLTGDRTLTVRTGDRSARVTVRRGAALHLDGQLLCPARDTG